MTNEIYQIWIEKASECGITRNQTWGFVNA